MHKFRNDLQALWDFMLWCCNVSDACQSPFHINFDSGHTVATRH